MACLSCFRDSNALFLRFPYKIVNTRTQNIDLPYSVRTTYTVKLVICDITVIKLDGSNGRTRREMIK
jgi:hypothetical protein